MKRTLVLLSILIFAGLLQLQAAESKFISIRTDQTNLIFKVGDNGRLYQSYLGQALGDASDLAYLPQGIEAYLTHGMEDYFDLPYASCTTTATPLCCSSMYLTTPAM